MTLKQQVNFIEKVIADYIYYQNNEDMLLIYVFDKSQICWYWLYHKIFTGDIFVSMKISDLAVQYPFVLTTALLTFYGSI